MYSSEKVANLKQRIDLLTKLIEAAEAEKAPEKYMTQTYKELNDAYAELKSLNNDL